MRDHLPVPYRNQWDVVRRDPVVTPIAAALVAAGVGATTATIVASVLVSVVTSLAVSLVTGFLSSLFAPKGPRPPDVKRELRREQSLPFKRFVYGEIFAPGTPAPWRVKGNVLYGCLILNSRASDGGNVRIRIDGRDVPLSNLGNITDFTAAGADVTKPATGPLVGFARFWLGLGDQTSPPDEVLSEAGDIFQSTDAWQGLTVLWCALDVGPSSSRLDRWPTTPPQIDVSMSYSLLWDPRDPAQTLAAPSTWKWSANQALCALDGHTQNPLQAYQEADLDIAQWRIAADVADDDVPLAAGGTEKRYEVHGFVVFNASELQQLLEPLFTAGAAERLVIGGRTSIVPGVFQEPAVTVTDVIGAGLSWETLQPVRDVANTVATTYLNEDRNEDAAELPPLSLPGSIDQDRGVDIVQRIELNNVKSFTQAARIQKVAAYRLRWQRRLTAAVPPENFNLVAGAGADIAFPSPFSMMNGTFQVEEVTPGLIPVDGDAVAMTLSCVFREYSRVAFDWDLSEEPDIPDAEPLLGEVPLPAPASLTATSATTGSGASIVGRALLEWPPIETAIIGYDVEYRLSGADWQSGPRVDPAIRDGSGDVFVFIAPLEVGESYDFRLRSVGAGRVSDFVEQSGILIGGTGVQILAPVNGSATPQGLDTINVAFTTPNQAGVAAINFYAGSTDPAQMSLLQGPIFVGPNQTVQIADVVGTATTQHYAARAADSAGVEGAFSAVVTATTPPDSE